MNDTLWFLAFLGVFALAGTVLAFVMVALCWLVNELLDWAHYRGTR